jgi:hypothetical protein
MAPDFAWRGGETQHAAQTRGPHCQRPERLPLSTFGWRVPMPFLVLTAILMLAGRLFPETPFGAWCNVAVTERLCDLIGRIERKHIVALVIGLVALQVFALAMPLDMAFAAMFDAATYIDVVMAAWAAHALNRGAAWRPVLPAHRLLTNRRNRRPLTTETVRAYPVPGLPQARQQRRRCGRRPPAPSYRPTAALFSRILSRLTQRASPAPAGGLEIARPEV